MSIGAIWMEVFSRNLKTDPTEGVGRDTVDADPTTAELLIVSPKALMQAPRRSTIASHVHDDPTFFDFIEETDVFKNKEVKS